MLRAYPVRVDKPVTVACVQAEPVVLDRDATLGRLEAHPLVGDVRGVGLILGMELMRDGERRIPFDSALMVGARVDAACQRHGLILRVVGDRLVFAPPLVIEAAEIEDISQRLEHALDDVAKDLKREGALQ